MKNKKIRERIFIVFFFVFGITTLVNGLFTLTGGYSFVEYFSLSLSFICLAISNFYLSKSNSIIKSVQYVLLIVLGIVSVWLLLLPMMTYGELEAIGYSLKRLNLIGGFQTHLYFVSIISIVLSLVKPLFVKRDNHILLVNKSQLVIGYISVLTSFVYSILLVVFNFKCR